VSTTSEVEIRIKGDDDSDSAFRKARNNEERLAASAKAAGIELTVMGRKGEAAGKITADGADRARAGVTRLNAGIDELNRGVRVLQEEFERTGDVDFLRQSKRLGAARKELEGFKKELESLGGDSGKGFVGRFLDEVSGGFKGDLGEKLQALPSQIKGALIAGVAGAAVAAAPALGAAVSMAVLGGVGVGGIIGGVALAGKDPQVAATAEDVGSHIGDSITGAAMDAFKQPTIESLRILEHGYDQIEPKITKIFQNLAPYTTRLAQGVVDGVDKIATSLETVSRRAGPELTELATDAIPTLADGIGKFMDEVSQGGPGAVQFTHDFAVGTSNMLQGLGAILKTLSQVYDFLRNSPLSSFVTGMGNALVELTGGTDKSKKALYDLKGSQDEAARAAETHAESLSHLRLGADLTAEDFGKLSGMISATAATTDVLASQMADKILNTTLNLDQATLGFAESQNHLSDVLAKTGIDMDIAHDKSQQMREGLLAVVAANIKTYDTNIAVGMSAEDAAAAYDEGTDSLINQMQQAGFTSEQIDELIGKYRGVPAQVDTTIATKGLTAAIDGLNDTIRLANHLDGRVSVLTIEERHRTTYDAGTPPSRTFHGFAAGGIKGAASGGARSNLTMVGEHGFELLNLPAGTTVHSNEDSRRMLANAGSGGGGGGTQILEVRPAPGFDSEIMRAFLGMIVMSLRNDAAFTGAVREAVA
jgi:hypothetical protein